jgi:uncharacterized protein YjbI with pentapeptide repeats
MPIAAGRDEFAADAPFAATEQKAWEFAAIACRQLGGLGVVRFTANDTDWFLVVRTLTRLDGAILLGTTLRGASLDGASVVDADLSGADLRGASLRSAFMNGANLTRTSLAGADFAASAGT